MRRMQWFQEGSKVHALHKALWATKRGDAVFGHETASFHGEPEGPRWLDDGTPAYTEWPHGRPTRRCPACDQPQTPEGHDPCIANLPGVKFACCGHGTKHGYIVFENGTVIDGLFLVRTPSEFSAKVARLTGADPVASPVTGECSAVELQPHGVPGPT